MYASVSTQKTGKITKYQIRPPIRKVRGLMNLKIWRNNPCSGEHHEVHGSSKKEVPDCWLSFESVLDASSNAVCCWTWAWLKARAKSPPAAYRCTPLRSAISDLSSCQLLNPPSTLQHLSIQQPCSELRSKRIESSEQKSVWLPL